ncbi:unnamed protein product [Pedinophyceae sp. YPF-701]|nr:unnamed protein product [Pedinophyceae sp. YPF-701]
MGCAGSKEEAPVQGHGGGQAASKAAAKAPVLPKAPPGDNWRDVPVPGIEVAFSDVASMPTWSKGGNANSMYGLLADGPDEDSDGAKTKDIKLQTAQGRPKTFTEESAHAAHSRLCVVQGTAMTIPYKIMVVLDGANDPQQSKNVEDIVQGAFDKINDHCNNWNPDSELERKINKQGGVSKPVAVSPLLGRLLAVAEQCVALTNGRFDPTILPVARTWRRALSEAGQPPTPAEVSHLKFAVGWQKNVQLSADRSSVALRNANTRLDFCGIAKGLAIDLICEDLQRAGFNDVLVEWGGDLRGVGQHPDGRPWRTTLVKPPPLKPLFKLWSEKRLRDAVAPEDATLFAKVESCAVATSGDYFQLHKFGFHHIYHPAQRTPMKLSDVGVASASVVAKSCAVADAIATAVMVSGNVDHAQRLLNYLVREGEVLGYAVLTRQGDPVVHGDMFTYVGSRPVSRAESRQQTARGTQKQNPLQERLLWAKLERATEGLPRAYKVKLTRADGKGSVGIRTFDMCSAAPTMCSAVVKQGSKLGKVSVGDEIEVTIPGTDVKVMCSVHTITPGCCDENDVLIMSVEAVEGNVCTGSDVRSRMKALMAALPMPVFLLTYMGLDRSMHAITASSVRLAEPGCVLFNVLKGSKAYLSMEGLEGSTVAMHLLHEGMEAMATQFVGNTDFNLEDFEGRYGKHVEVTEGGAVLFESGVTVVCKVAKVIDAGDHAVVMAGIDDVTQGHIVMQPENMLLYCQRAFCRLKDLPQDVPVEGTQ